MLLLENEALMVKTKCFQLCHENGPKHKKGGVGASACGKNRQGSIVCQTDDADFSGLLGRVVFRQLLKWLASGFQFGCIALPVQLLWFLHFHPRVSFATDTPLPPSFYLLVAEDF